MKKRIVIITPGPIMSIKENFYRNLSKYCYGDVFTSSGRKEVLNTKELYSFTFHVSKFNFVFKPFFLIKYFFYCVFFALKLRIAGHKYDIVTTYDPLKTGLIGFFVSKILNAKFVPEVNGVYTSDAEYIDDVSLATQIKKAIYPRLERIVLRHADGIKLLFPTQIKEFEDVMDNTVIRSFFAYSECDLFLNIHVEEKKEVLFVGFPFKRKGVDILIKAFKKIAPDFPDWKLKILGWFPDRHDLEEAMGSHPQIYHHEPVEFFEMPEHIGSCSILVLPSRSEAMGRVLIEAMATSRPVIGANVDGIPTVINDGMNGLLFEKENVNDLADKLIILMTNPELRKQIGEKGRLRAQSEFSIDTYFNQLTEFYGAVLDKDKI